MQYAYYWSMYDRSLFSLSLLLALPCLAFRLVSLFFFRFALYICITFLFLSFFHSFAYHFFVALVQYGQVFDTSRFLLDFVLNLRTIERGKSIEYHRMTCFVIIVERETGRTNFLVCAICSSIDVSFDKFIVFVMKIREAKTKLSNRSRDYIDEGIAIDVIAVCPNNNRWRDDFSSPFLFFSLSSSFSTLCLWLISSSSSSQHFFRCEQRNYIISSIPTIELWWRQTFVFLLLLLSLREEVNWVVILD